MRSRGSGFTILEVLIVLLIVAFLVGTAAIKMGKTFRSESRAVQWRLASVVKYLYNTSATENKTSRLVLDIETNSYWAEETTERFLIGMEKEEGKKAEAEEEKKEESEAESAAGEEKEEGGGGEEAAIEPLAPTFGSADSPLLEVKKFPSNVILKDVYTPRSAEGASSGRAYIYFFPNGTMEESIINFKDSGDEKHLSIKFNPFNGEANVSNEYRKLGK